MLREDHALTTPTFKYCCSGCNKGTFGLVLQQFGPCGIAIHVMDYHNILVAMARNVWELSCLIAKHGVSSKAIFLISFVDLDVDVTFLFNYFKRWWGAV